MKKELAFVVPAFNPHENWHEILVTRFLEIQTHIPFFQFHLYIVNDGSSVPISKESIQYIQREIPNATYLTYEHNQGKGHALRYGVSHAKEEYVLYTDIDIPYTSQSIIRLLELLPQHDVVMAIKNEKYYQYLTPQRRFISKSLQFCIRLLFRKLPTADTQCGLKAMNAKGKEQFVATTIERYLFDLEFVYLAAKNNLDIHTFEVELREGILFRKMDKKILLQELQNLGRLLLKRN